MLDRDHKYKANTYGLVNRKSENGLRTFEYLKMLFRLNLLVKR